MKKIKTPFRYLINAVLVAAVFLILNRLFHSGSSNYFAYQLIPICYSVILAVSLNLTCGFLGQLPLGHAGFMAVGAYASAIFVKAVTEGSLPLFAGFDPNTLFFLSVLLGGLLAAAAGIIVGLPALRLRGDYLAILTLGFGEIIRIIILNLKITGGGLGLRSIPKMDKHTLFVWAFGLMVVTVFVIHTLVKSSHGRAIISIRENEIAAAACGVNTTYYKMLAFTIAAFFAGVAGAIYARYVGNLAAGNFGFTYSIEILVMVVLGGMGSIAGSIISASALTVLPELLRAFSDYRMVAYSLLLVVVMIFKPSGLMGTREFSFSDMLEKLFSKRRKGGEKS